MLVQQRARRYVKCVHRWGIFSWTSSAVLSVVFLPCIELSRLATDPPIPADVADAFVSTSSTSIAYSSTTRTPISRYPAGHI